MPVILSTLLHPWTRMYFTIHGKIRFALRRHGAPLVIAMLYMLPIIVMNLFEFQGRQAVEK